MPLAYQPSCADFLATRPKDFLPIPPQSLPVDPSVVGLRILPLRMSPLPTSPHSSTFLYSYHLLLNSFLLLSSSTLNFCISVRERRGHLMPIGQDHTPLLHQRPQSAVSQGGSSSREGPIAQLGI